MNLRHKPWQILNVFGLLENVNTFGCYTYLMVSQSYILLELSKLRAVKVGGNWRLTEILKKQLTVLEKMKIGILLEANLVIKMAVV